MKSYDDLQRFKEKTQTTHIEFKDLSEQARNTDNINWAIIKQLANDGADTVFENSQTINVVTPQPADPSAFVPVASAPASVAEPLPPFRTLGQTTQNSGSLLDSISASLKPETQAEVVPPVSPVVSPGPSPMTVPAQPSSEHSTTVKELRPESVAHATGSLFDQLVPQSPIQSAPQPQQSRPLQQAFSPNADRMHSSKQPQLVSPESLHQLLQESRPVHPDYPSRPVETGYPAESQMSHQPQQISQALHFDHRMPHQPSLSPGYAPTQPNFQSVSQPVGYPPQPNFQSVSQPVGYPPQPASHSSSYPLNAPGMQGRASETAASSNISYKHLFSPADKPAEQANSKEMSLQSLLEKIASCR